MLLSSFDCNEDTGIAEVKKSVAAMEENLERLTKQEYAAELENALKQFSELREQAKEKQTGTIRLVCGSESNLPPLRKWAMEQSPSAEGIVRHIECAFLTISCLSH